MTEDHATAEFLLGIWGSAFTSKFRALFRVLQKGSPLNCALICGAHVDRCLETILEQYFIKSTTADKLLDPSSGQIGSAAIRARLAYCLGIIDKNTMELIESVAYIRNVFAHSPERIGFDAANTRVWKKANAMIELIGPSAGASGRKMVLKNELDCRAIFTVATLNVISRLIPIPATFATLGTPRYPKGKQENSLPPQSP